MKKLILITLLVLCCANLRAEIAVICNLENDSKQMTKQEVEEIFMGRSHLLPNGDFALPLDYLDLRPEFYNKLTNRPIEQIDAYWARIIFSGLASPPMKLPDEQTVIKTVSKNNGAIGYIDSKNVDKKLVRVLLLLK